MKAAYLRIIFRSLVYLFAVIGFAFSCVFIGMQYNIFSVKGSISDRNTFFQQTASSTLPTIAKDNYVCTDGTKVCDIFLTPEWQTVAYGLQKDTKVLLQVSKETGVPVRLLISLAVPEQLRFFSAEREVYKKYFEPLKVLGVMSQFSLGITGIKPRTASDIELALVSTTSPYYLGVEYEKTLTYADGIDKDKEQYARLTDSKNHYYSYLYTALFIKEIDASWTTAGFPIAKDKQGVYATLFNIGFVKSRPNANPQVGGAYITVGGKSYTYGEVAQRFLESKELEGLFPRE